MKAIKHKVPENNETAEKNNKAIERQQSCIKIMNLQAFLFSTL
jgi:hypothetical protein